MDQAIAKGKVSRERTERLISCVPICDVHISLWVNFVTTRPKYSVYQVKWKLVLFYHLATCHEKIP